MARTGMRLEGDADMDKRLSRVEGLADRDFLEQLAVSALAPVADAARGIVRQRSGRLHDSLAAGTRLSHSQAADEIRDPDVVAAYVGPGSMAQAITEEFGTVDEVGNPYLRPAWDENVGGVQAAVRNGLGDRLRRLAKG